MRPTRIRFIVLAGLCGAAALAYFVRNGVASAESTIRTSLDITKTESGWMMSAFFWPYALCQIPAAMLAQRMGTRRALSLYCVLWSLATAGMALGNLGVMIGSRAFMGVAQAGLVLPLSTKKALSIPAGSAFCGIDSIFPNGFEPASFAAINQLSGGIASPGLTQDITGTGALSVTITSPAAGATTGDSTVDVSGTFVGPVNTGITVNGASGYTANGRFLVPNVPLNAGSNPLNATATILPGATASYAGSITQSGTALPISTSANHPSGYAPVPITFGYSIGALTSGFPVQSVAINFSRNVDEDLL